MDLGLACLVCLFACTKDAQVIILQAVFLVSPTRGAIFIN